MDSPGAVGRRRGTSRVNAEDQALDQIAKEKSKKSICISRQTYLSFGREENIICGVFRRINHLNDIFFLYGKETRFLIIYLSKI
uniref:Uncharacterized protein n=1 Tax=Megaselia scalaris TaxID=36166 RepID=T1GN07_MEGSC